MNDRNIASGVSVWNPPVRSHTPDYPPPAPILNWSQGKNWKFHRHYSEYYDDDSRDLVATFHARDIEAIGYRFESPSNGLRWLLAEKIKPRVKCMLRSFSLAFGFTGA